MFLLHAFEQLESIATGHFQVGDHHGRERKSSPIGEGVFAAQIFGGFVAVRANVDAHLESCFFEGALEKKRFVWIIFGHQNYTRL
jgi:hypothetical protein